MLRVQELRSEDFTSLQRALLWAGGLLGAYIAALVFLHSTAHGLNDFQGHPLGADFSNIYAAGRSVLQGNATAAFNPLQQHAQEQALFGKATPFYGWHYPPFFFLVSAPLALFPYLTSLLVWQAVTLLFYLVGIWVLLRNSSAPEAAHGWMWAILALGFPAIFLNVMHGQSGFLTAALFAGALAIVDERPLLAGCLFALLAYKPQLGLMIPLALMAEGRWRTIAAAVATVMMLIIVAVGAFGLDAWGAFFESLSFTRAVSLERGGGGFSNIQSVFGWVRMWHGAVPLAYVLQAFSTAIVGAMLFRFWRSDVSRAQKGAALCMASLLAAPYCFDYDMMVLAPAVALLATDGFANGFPPWHKIAATGLWFVPLVARPLAATTCIPIGISMSLAAFVLLTRQPISRPQRKPVS